MTTSPNVSIVVGSVTLREINTFKIRLSMTEGADSFQATISDRVVLEDGATVEVSIEDRIVLVGEMQVDRLAKSAGARDMSISGYSSARRLVKSSVIVGDGLAARTSKNLTLEEIVTAVCDPFDIVVDVSESAAVIAREQIPKVRLGNGEKAWAFCKRVCKRQGCILVSGAASVTPDRAAKPSVRITRVGVRSSPVAIEYGDPRCLAIGFESDVGNVHSEYIVTRRGGGVRDEDGEIVGRDGRATDERVPYSPLLMQAAAGGNSQAALDNQAEFEMRKRAAEGDRATATYQGWSPNESQALWWPNTLYQVIDAEENYSESLVLASVELSLSGSGTTANLEFMAPDAYAVLGKPKIKKTKKRRKVQTLLEYALQHSVLATAAGALLSDKISYKKLKGIYIPEDPDA